MKIKLLTKNDRICMNKNCRYVFDNPHRFFRVEPNCPKCGDFSEFNVKENLRSIAIQKDDYEVICVYFPICIHSKIFEKIISHVKEKFCIKKMVKISSGGIYCLEILAYNPVSENEIKSVRCFVQATIENSMRVYNTWLI